MGVTSAEVESYKKTVESYANRFSRLPDMQNEFDDFVQEGLIAVWDSLQKGVHPSAEFIQNRMRMWARTQRRKGLGGFDELPEEVPALV